MNWISVADGLPSESDGTAVVHTSCGQILTAWASYWHGASNEFAHWTFPHDADEDLIVTHWLPLPSSPGKES